MRFAPGAFGIAIFLLKKENIEDKVPINDTIVKIIIK